MSEKRCKTCRFWDTVNRVQGECRVGPPEPCADTRGRWPLTLADDWCGIHAAPDEDEDEDDYDLGGEG